MPGLKPVGSDKAIYTGFFSL